MIKLGQVALGDDRRYPDHHAATGVAVVLTLHVADSRHKNLRDFVLGNNKPDTHA